MFNLVDVDPSWQTLLKTALAQMDPVYLQQLETQTNWLPGKQNIFNAFNLPLDNTRYILLGESPYPRASSANGYAFWDAAVDSIWSEKGLSKSVNRATSLRNFIKMLMLCNNTLSSDNLTQPAIAVVDKQGWVNTLSELFQNLLDEGFLLLNASLALSELSVSKESRYWQPFLFSLLRETTQISSSIQLILLGNIAKKLEPILSELNCQILIAEHPYNISFMHNMAVQNFFKPFNLLKNRDKLPALK